MGRRRSNPTKDDNDATSSNGSPHGQRRYASTDSLSRTLAYTHPSRTPTTTTTTYSQSRRVAPLLPGGQRLSKTRCGSSPSSPLKLLNHPQATPHVRAAPFTFTSSKFQKDASSQTWLNCRRYLLSPTAHDDGICSGDLAWSSQLQVWGRCCWCRRRGGRRSPGPFSLFCAPHAATGTRQPASFDIETTSRLSSSVLEDRTSK